MKKKIRKKLHPVIVFAILTLIVMIASSVGNLFKLEASYYRVNLVTGALESELVTIDSLFNRTGIQYLVSNMVSNFINFAPLGMIIVGLLGVGVAYKSGFLTALFKQIKKVPSKKFITFLVVLLGILTSMFYDVGYVILIPLSAILFMTLGRHPSAGICAAFAGITFGYGANVVINGLDISLVGYTSSSASILDANYVAKLDGNLIFIIISTFLLAWFGMMITEKFIVPKLGRYQVQEEETLEENLEISQLEKKGLAVVTIFMLPIILILIYCIIPGLPFSGLFLHLSGTSYPDQLFSNSSYFNQGSVFIFSVLLIISGLIFGLRTKTIKTSKDFVEGMNHYLSNFSSLLVMIFFAAQLSAVFKKSNIGVFITASLAEVLGNLELTGILLVIVSFLIVIICSIFLPVASTKWAILAPVMVPMFMQSTLTPEFAQAVFRAGDSAIKGITPLFTYFVIFIGFLQIYNQKKQDNVSITDAMSLMAPYTIGYTLLWLLIIIIFFIVGLPLGPGVGTVLGG